MPMWPPGMLWGHQGMGWGHQGMPMWPPGVLWGHQGCYGATRDAYAVRKGCVGIMGGAAGPLRNGLGSPGLLWGH